MKGAARESRELMVRRDVGERVRETERDQLETTERGCTARGERPEQQRLANVWARPKKRTVKARMKPSCVGEQKRCRSQDELNAYRNEGSRRGAQSAKPRGLLFFEG